MAVVVTVTKGYDLGYAWKNQGQPGAEQTAGGYYINSHGRPGVSMPCSLAEFYEMIRTPDMSEYTLS